MDWCSESQWCSTWAAEAQKLWETSQFSGWTLLITLLPIWVLGALTGYLLPRPKASPLSIFQAAFMNSTARRALLAYQAFRITRVIWYHWTCPGTFRQFTRAVFKWICGQGWTFDFPTAKEAGASEGTPCAPVQPSTPATPDNWYVNEKDLAFFQYHAEGSGAMQGASNWEVLMDKEILGVIKYTSWRRMLPNGKTEYKSLTISPDATHHEFMDLYLDDDNRPKWDTMIIDHSVLEYGNFDERQAVVRWVRRFPFSFISDREYTIAKRCFKQGDALYAVTKAIDHPRAPQNTDVVKCDVFYSMWRSRTVACPWGSGLPACETLLLHHEQFKIPENLARFAVKHGMWGFVRKLSTETQRFVGERRKRCSRDEPDSHAYGYGHAPNPPSQSLLSLGEGHDSAGIRRANTMGSPLSSLTPQSSVDLGTGLNTSAGLHGSLSCGDLCGGESTRTSTLQRARSSSKVRGLAAFAVASGIAMLMRKSSQERLSSGGRSGSRRAPATATFSGCSPSHLRARREREQERALRRARSHVVFSEGCGVPLQQDMPEGC